MQSVFWSSAKYEILTTGTHLHFGPVYVVGNMAPKTGTQCTAWPKIVSQDLDNVATKLQELLQSEKPLEDDYL